MELATGPPSPHLLVELWEDLVCPWCLIGRRRLQKAVQAFEHPAAVTVRSRPYQLAPQLPPRLGEPVTSWLAGWGLSSEQVERKLERAASAAAEEGLRVDLHRAVAANTLAAHRLVELGWQTGGAPLQSAVVERLFAAHFEEGLAIDEPDVLFRLGAEAGLEPSGLPAFLAGTELTAQVRQGEETARDLGIGAVPCFVVGRRLAVSGAESTEVLLSLLRRAYQDAEVYLATQPDQHQG